jgi:hypothetical protein
MIMAQRPKNLLAFISIKKSCISAGTPGAFLREYFSRNCRLRYFDEEACVNASAQITGAPSSIDFTQPGD